MKAFYFSTLIPRRKYICWLTWVKVLGEIGSSIFLAFFQVKALMKNDQDSPLCVGIRNVKGQLIHFCLVIF